MSNSNFNITKVTVDPTSQEITNLEINGKSFESGGEVEFEEKTYDADNKLNIESLFGPKPTPVQVRPSSGYDGISLLTINPNGLTGYPGGPQTLQSTLVISCDENGNPDPNAEAADAIVSYDTESLLPLITNIWVGSSSFSKLNILSHHASGGGDYYIYQISDSGDYPYIKEVD